MQNVISYQVFHYEGSYRCNFYFLCEKFRSKYAHIPRLLSFELVLLEHVVQIIIIIILQDIITVWQLYDALTPLRDDILSRNTSVTT